MSNIYIKEEKEDVNDDVFDRQIHEGEHSEEDLVKIEKLDVDEYDKEDHMEGHETHDAMQVYVETINFKDDIQENGEDDEFEDVSVKEEELRFEESLQGCPEAICKEEPIHSDPPQDPFYSSAGQDLEEEDVDSEPNTILSDSKVIGIKSLPSFAAVSLLRESKKRQQQKSTTSSSPNFVIKTKINGSNKDTFIFFNNSSVVSPTTSATYRKKDMKVRECVSNTNLEEEEECELKEEDVSSPAVLKSYIQKEIILPHQSAANLPVPSEEIYNNIIPLKHGNVDEKNMGYSTPKPGDILSTTRKEAPLVESVYDECWGKFRSCRYCRKSYRNLSEHFRKVHKKERAVKTILDKNYEKSVEDWKLNLLKLRKGIKKGKEKVSRGKSGPAQKYDSLKIFTCKGLTSHQTISSKGKKTKMGKKRKAILDSVYRTQSLNFHEDFRSAILKKFRFDKIYEVILKDVDIQICGNLLFQKLQSDTEGSGSSESSHQEVRNFMWRLAFFNKTFHELPDIGPKKNKLSNIFQLQNYRNFKKAIVEIIYTIDDGTCKLRKKFARIYESTISDSLQFLTSFYSGRFRDVAQTQAKSLIDFTAYHKKNSDLLFGHINSQDNLRKVQIWLLKNPAENELEEIVVMSNRVLDKFQDPSFEKNTDSFSQLRRAVSFRLIFFNGLPPVNVASLLVLHWNQAKERALTHLSAGSELEEIFSSFKVICNDKSSKVDIVVPKSVFGALDLLASSEFRRAAHIPRENKYLLPATTRSLQHSFGCADIRNFLQYTGTELKSDSDHVRNMISEKIGMADYPEELREVLDSYRKMGRNVERPPETSEAIRVLAPLLFTIQTKFSGAKNKSEAKKTKVVFRPSSDEDSDCRDIDDYDDEDDDGNYYPCSNEDDEDEDDDYDDNDDFFHCSNGTKGSSVREKPASSLTQKKKKRKTESSVREKPTSSLTQKKKKRKTESSVREKPTSSLTQKKKRKRRKTDSDCGDPPRSNKVIWTDEAVTVLEVKFAGFIAGTEGYPCSELILEHISVSPEMSGLSLAKAEAAMKRKLQKMRRLKKIKIEKDFI